MTETAFILGLDDPTATLERVGGKGASLARLARAGLPVPAAFHITTAAYTHFVETNAIQTRIVDIARHANADDSVSLEHAAAAIAGLFEQRNIPQDVADAIKAAYARLEGDSDNASVAVRSSATAEDLPELSFAGQQDTYLAIRGEAAVLDAVKRCWASLWTARALAYRARKGIAPDSVLLAVVVQTLVPADAAGVLFTANPLEDGLKPGQLVINAAWGLGEAVVSGQVTPDIVAVDKSTGETLYQQISDKASMVVVAPEGGTREAPVPPGRGTEAVLASEQVAALVRLGLRIEALYGQPMDIEWAMHDGRLFVLQARPITGRAARSAASTSLEVWNDSLDGDYLWTSANLAEAIPDVMTPSTWSRRRRLRQRYDVAAHW
jgi:rifampicin phosphotransferase